MLFYFTCMDSSLTLNHDLLQWNRVTIVRLQCDLVNTKESVLPVCDISYDKNKRKVQKGEVIKV